MRRPMLEFWYEFASTYSYVAAMRIEAAADAAEVDLAWRPFLLGPIFAKQGWTSSPFNIYPAKGRYMWRDMERLTRALGLTLTRPKPFPQNSLIAARLASIGEEAGWVAPFSKAVYLAEFADGRDISDPATLRAVLVGLALPADDLLRRARGDEGVKGRLKTRSDEAERRGLFGAPSFVTEDGEIFWGNDRLDDALAWAAGRR